MKTILVVLLTTVLLGCTDAPMPKETTTDAVQHVTGNVETLPPSTVQRVTPINPAATPARDHYLLVYTSRRNYGVNSAGAGSAKITNCIIGYNRNDTAWFASEQDALQFVNGGFDDESEWMCTLPWDARYARNPHLYKVTNAEITLKPTVVKTVQEVAGWKAE